MSGCFQSHVGLNIELFKYVKNMMADTTEMLTLKIIRLAIHENIIDKNHTENARPKMEITENKNKANVLQTNTSLD